MFETYRLYVEVEYETGTDAAADSEDLPTLNQVATAVRDRLTGEEKATGGKHTRVVPIEMEASFDDEALDLGHIVIGRTRRAGA